MCENTEEYHCSIILSRYESVLAGRRRNIVEETLGPWQHGFRRGKGTTDMTFVLRQLMKKPMRSGHTPTHHNYIVAYADDIVQTAASEGEFADIMNVWQAAFNKYHLKLNLLKTEVMIMSRSHQTLNIIGDHTLNQVQSFKYLGSTVNEQSTQEEYIWKSILDFDKKC